MAEEQNAAVGLEERLSNFDALTDGTGDDFENVLKDLENSPSAKEEEAPKAEETPKEDEKSEKKEASKGDSEDEEEEAPKAEEEEDEFFNEFGEGGEKEEPEEDEDDTPESLSKAGKEDWAKLRAAKAELRTKLKATESELQELRKQVAELPELREKAKYLEEAEKELALSRVEATREYKEKVEKPLKEIESTALQIAKSNDVSADKLFDALAEPDPGTRRQLLKEITEDMDAVDRDDVFQMARTTQSLLAEQNEIRAKARDAAKESSEIEAKRKAAEEAQARQQYEEELSDVVPALRKRLPFEELTKGETEDGVYEVIAQKAEGTDFSSFSPRQKAFAVTSALMMPRMAKQLQAAQQKISTLESRVKEFNTKEPRVGDTKVDRKSDDYEGDIEAAVAAAVGGKTQRPITDILAEF